MCQECGCMKPSPIVMPMLDMSYLWQDGQFYWDDGDGENVPIQEISDAELMRGCHFINSVLLKYNDTYKEAVDTMEVFPDFYKASMLNSMEQTANIMFELLEETHRRQRKALNGW